MPDHPCIILSTQLFHVSVPHVPVLELLAVGRPSVAVVQHRAVITTVTHSQYNLYTSMGRQMNMYTVMGRQMNMYTVMGRQMNMYTVMGKQMNIYTVMGRQMSL